jgi:hypothetical protein
VLQPAEVAAAAVFARRLLTGRNPEGYLPYRLELIPEQPINRIEELLPWHIAGKLPQLRIAIRTVTSVLHMGVLMRLTRHGYQIG